MPSKDHKLLMKTLNKLVKQERWRKLKKLKGKVTEISKTKSGNLKLIINETSVYVLKRNKNLYATAETIKQNEMISVALRTHLGKYYVLKITKQKDKTLGEFTA